jgi:hypothetical protein
MRKKCLITGRMIKLTNNYRWISLLSTSYTILSNILLSRLSPCIDEIIGDHKCGFWRNRSITDEVFCIRQILETKLDYNETVHQLFIDFKKAYDSVRREVLYNILREFGIPTKLVRLIKIWLNETYSKVHIGKLLHIPLKYTCNCNWEFIGVTFILSVHNMFRPLWAILRWNTTTSLTYFVKSINTTTDPLFYNCSLIWCKSLIIYFTIHIMVNEFLFYRKVDNKRLTPYELAIVKQRIRCSIDGFFKICKWCSCISPEDGP